MDIEFHELLNSLSSLDREKEQEKLESAWDALRQGQGSSWLVIGQESDVGQNLFARMVLSQHPGTCYYARCQSLPLFGPYDPWFQCFPEFFSQYARNMQQAREKLGQKKQSNKKNTTAQSSSSKTTEDASKTTAATMPSIQLDWPEPNNMYLTWPKQELLVQLLVQWICQQPLPAVIYMEDLHFADFASLQLWQALRNALQFRPVLMLATASYQTSSAPELPAHLRNERVSVLQQLQALHNMGKAKMQSRQERAILQEIYRESSLVVLNLIPEKTSWAAIKSVFHADTDHDFLVNLAKRSQGNPFWISQFLVYLLELVDLTEEGWKFKTKEDELEIPRSWEELCQSNLSKLDTPTTKALELAACYPGAIPEDIWLACCEYDEDTWKKIQALAYDEGVMRKSPDGKTWMFLHEKQRQALVSQISSPRQKAIHQQLAELLKSRQFPIYRILYHLDKGDGSDNKLLDLMAAGQYAEDLLAPLAAHPFYKEAIKEAAGLNDAVTKECEDMARKPSAKKLSSPSSNKSSSSDTTGEDRPQGLLDWFGYKISGYTRQQKQSLAKRLLEVLRWYRVSHLEASAIFTKDFQKIFRKIISWMPASQYLPTLWPLVQYLTALVAESERQDVKEITKSYPKEDVAFLWDTITHQILPRKAYQEHIYLRQIATQAKLPSDIYPNISYFYAKISQSQKTPSEKITYMMDSSWSERQEKSFASAIDTLFRQVQLCRRLQQADLVPLEATLLHQIGITYQQWAKIAAVQQATPEEIQSYWQQSAAAYCDVAACLWNTSPARLMPLPILQHACKLCTTHQIDDIEYKKYLETLKNKYESRKEEQEYQSKGLIICDEEDIGAADHLEMLLHQHNIDAEVKVNPDDLNWQKWTSEYAITMAIVSRYAHTWEESYSALCNQTLGMEAQYQEHEFGWGVADLPRHVRFIFWGETPGILYTKIVQFCHDKILSKYI